MRLFSFLWIYSVCVVSVFGQMASRQYVDLVASRTNNPHQVTARQAGAIGTNGTQKVAQDFLLSSDPTPPGMAYISPPRHFRLSSDRLILQSDHLANVTLDNESIFWSKNIGSFSGGGSIPSLKIDRYSIQRWDSLPDPEYPMFADPVESTFLFPLIDGTNTLAVISEVEAIAEKKKSFNWDPYAKVLWRTSYSNGYIIVTAVTNTPSFQE